MILHIAKDYNDMSRKAANIISAKIIIKPDSILGLATGSTPKGTYKQLIEWYNKGDIDFSKTKSVNLDEYKNLSSSNEQSYAYFMQENFFNHINIDKNNTFIPNGLAQNPEQECARYDSVIKDLGGIDLQLLGIGSNGHIGFNEPSDHFKKGTHLVELAKETVLANSRFFNNIDEVPKFAYSMGIQSIMYAKSILLLASGKEKAEAVYQLFKGNISPKVPATILQLHPNVTVIADEDACQLLK